MLNGTGAKASRWRDVLIPQKANIQEGWKGLEVAGLGSNGIRRGRLTVVAGGVTPTQGVWESHTQGEGPEVDPFNVCGVRHHVRREDQQGGGPAGHGGGPAGHGGGDRVD